MKLGLQILPIWVAALLLTCTQSLAIEGAVIDYASLSGMSQDAFQRILEADSVRYVCSQHQARSNFDWTLARQRAQQLKDAGKRLVIQIWWGPSGEFPWSKYSFPNIARDPAIRADFFTYVVDPVIAGYGVENLYGVHLLEETGMQFATDVGNRADPDDFWTYTEPTSSYNTPWYSGYKPSPDSPDGGVNIANLRRYESDFTSMTGFTFAQVAGNELVEHLFSRWIANRIQSAGQVEFAKYIHQTYPGLKAFTWDFIYTAGENPRTDHQLESQFFDGVIGDMYSLVGLNFLYQRAYRTLYPNAEIINFAMGGMGDIYYPYESPNTKRARTAVAYMSGANAVGFFEYPVDYTRPDSWSVNTDIFDKVRQLPRFEKTSQVLVISDGVSTIWHFPWAWTGLKYFDFLPTWEAHSVDLSRYQVVILHAHPIVGASRSTQIYWNSDALKQQYGLPGYLDYRKFDSFVANGGTLIISGHTNLKADCPLFVVREGYLRTADSSTGGAETLRVSPVGWLYEVGLRRSYNTTVTKMPVAYYDSSRVTQTSAGYYFQYGQGEVFFFPFLRHYDPQEAYTSQMWQDYRQLLTDVTRAVIGLASKRDIVDDYIDSPQIGNYYMEATSDSRQQTTYLLLDGWPGMMVQQQWQLTGADVFTAAVNPILSYDRYTAIFNSNLLGSREFTLAVGWQWGNEAPRYASGNGAHVGPYVAQDTNLGGIYDVFYSSGTGKTYAAGYNGNCVRQYNGQTGAPEKTLISGLNLPWGISIYGDHIYVVNSGTGKVHRYSLADGARDMSYEVTTSAWYISHDSSGNLYTTNTDGTGGKVFNVNGGFVRDLAPCPTGGYWSSIAIDSSDTAYGTAFGSYMIYRFSSDGSIDSSFTPCSTTGQPLLARFGPDGRLYVTLHNNAFIAERYLISSKGARRDRAFQAACSYNNPGLGLAFIPTDSAATPRFSINGGVIDGPTNVTITCATPQATIRYTTDGSDPDTGHGTAVSSGSSVAITPGMTLKAKAWAQVCFPSRISAASFSQVDFGLAIGWQGTGDAPRYNPVDGSLIDPYIAQDTTLGGIMDVFYSSATGKTYASGSGGNCIRQYDGQTGALEKTLVSGLSSPWGISVYGNHIYVANTSINKVYRYSLATGERDTGYNVSVTSPMYISHDSYGNLYVTSNSSTDKTGKVYNSSGTLSGMYAAPSNGRWSGIVIDSSRKVYGLKFDPPYYVYRFSGNGSIDTRFTPFVTTDQPVAAKFGPDGKLYVALNRNGLYSVERYNVGTTSGAKDSGFQVVNPASTYGRGIAFTPLAPRPDAPAFAPDGGTITGPIDVTITGQAGATIRYTTDGSVPSNGSPAIASGSTVTVTSGTTLNAKSWKPGMLASVLKSASYLSPSGYTIAEVKALEDNTLVSTTGRVTAVFGGVFYIESPDRSSGIRVQRTGHGVAPGWSATVTGRMATIADTGERYIDASAGSVSGTIDDFLAPLGMNNRSIGGSGVSNGSGMNNIGLFVKAWGKATSLGGGLYLLDDGSGLNIATKLSSGTISQTDYLVVTGIISAELTGDGIKPVLLVQSELDVQTL